MAPRKPGGKSPGGKAKPQPLIAAGAPEARTYEHPEAKTLLRPDVGTQASFRKKKPAQTDRYDSPFEAGDYAQIVVKVIDDRGNELLVVRNLDEAEA